MAFPTANFGPFAHLDTSDEISKGNIEGESTFTVTGVNHDMDTDTREDLWPEGGILIYLPAAETMNYVSDNPADNNSIFISGDLAGVTVTEQVSLNGTTPVPGSQLFDVINFMFLMSGDTNAGFVTATATGEGTAQCSIFPGEGISQHGFFRVPMGYSVIFRQIAFNTARQQAGQDPIVNFNLYARFTPASPWVSLIDARMDAGVQSGIVIPYPVSNIIVGGADIRLSAVSTEANTEAAVRLVGVRYAV